MWYLIYFALLAALMDKGKFLLAARRFRQGAHTEYIISYCVEAQHYTTIVPDSLFFTWWIVNFVRPDGQPCVEAQEFGLVRNMLIAAVEERYKDAGNDPFVLCIHSVHRGLHIECLTMIPPSVVLSKLSECWTNITSLLLCNHVLQRNKTHWSWRNTLILKSNYH